MGRGVPKSLLGAPQPWYLVTKTWPRFLGESRTPKHPPVGSVTASANRLGGALWSKCELEYFWRGVDFCGENGWKYRAGRMLQVFCASIRLSTFKPQEQSNFATGGIVTALPGVRTSGNTTGFGWFYKTRSSRGQAITPGFAFLLNGGLRNKALKHCFLQAPCSKPRSLGHLRSETEKGNVWFVSTMCAVGSGQGQAPGGENAHFPPFLVQFGSICSGAGHRGHGSPGCPHRIPWEALI